MIDINIENDILNYYSTKKIVHISKMKLEWKIYLEQRFNDSTSISESFYRIKYKIYKRPTCVICGKPAKFIGQNNYVFASTCGNKTCTKTARHNGLLNMPNEKKLLISEKIKQTCLQKYGCTSPLASTIVKEKIKHTCLEKYGVDNPAKATIVKEKYKQTCLEKYGVDAFTKTELQKSKSRQTKLERYGNEYYLNREQAVKNTDYKLVYSKSKQTKLERYGDENYNNSQKRINTCNSKYGGPAPSFSQEVKDKMSNTCMKKYGVSSYFLTDECRQKLNSQECKNKKYETKKKNHTFNTSKPEIQTYNILKEKYPDVIYQYKDKDRYPFVCDFYIPSLDLYIECNYHWTHGGKPYEGTDEDKLIIEKWKAKNTKFYNNAINCWTIRDVNKRNIAKQNNLNYIEIWNINELYNELETIISNV